MTDKRVIKDPIILSILEHCKEQADYYREIAYKSDYKDETVNRIVNLGIAYEDVTMFIELLLSKAYSQVQLQQAMIGDPTIVGQALDKATNTTTQTCQETDT